MNLNDLYEMKDPRDAYERDVANSTSGFGKNSQAYRADGGANDERHDLDQQPTWYIRLNGKLIRDKAGSPYSFQSKAAANKAALTMQAKLFNKDKEFVLTTNPNDKSQGVAEDKQNSIAINGKEVDYSSLEVDGVDSRDYPDFSDAYFSSGYFTDGTSMSDEDLDQLTNTHGEMLYDKAYDSLHEASQAVDERTIGQPRVAAAKPEILSAVDDNKTITIRVRAPDGTSRSFSNSNPLIMQNG